MLPLLSFIINTETTFWSEIDDSSRNVLTAILLFYQLDGNFVWRKGGSLPYTADLILEFVHLLTWLSFKPNFSANFFLSGLLMYFCIWNRLSKPFLCRSLKTALRIIPLLGFPLPLCAHGNVPGNGNTADCVVDTGVDTGNIKRFVKNWYVNLEKFVSTGWSGSSKLILNSEHVFCFFFS